MVFGSADLNKNNTIDREEFLKLMKMMAGSNPPADDKILKEFDRYDVNKDEQFDKFEFRTLVTAIIED